MLKEVILLMILIILLIFVYKSNINSELYINNNGYTNYRLGDFIKGYLYRKKDPVFNSIINDYPTSICSKYYNKVMNLPDSQKWNNYKILQEIINEIDIDSSSDEDLIVHLRLGDVITHKNGKFEYLTNSVNRPYGIDLNKLKNFISKNKNKFNKFIFVYGIHKKIGIDFPQGIDPSLIYLENLRYFLEQNNIKYKERHNNNPDIDFAFMCKSKNFMPSGSGFSDLIVNIVKLNKNKIYYC